jgi:hypothetical protein
MDKLVEKFKALGIGEKIIIIAAVVLFIDGFLPWYNIDFGPFGSVSWNAWEGWGEIWSILAILIGLVMAGVVVVKGLTDVEIPDNVSGVTWPKILLGGGMAAVVLVVIKLLNESSHLGFGFYVGIIAAIALAAGGYMMYREESTA